MAKDKKAPAGEEKKKQCAITREDFKKAPILTLDVTDGEGNPLAKFLCAPKDFSTGSFGWGASDKMTLTINGTLVKVQCSINLTVVASKEAPK